jgi:hypothetical protein
MINLKDIVLADYTVDEKVEFKNTLALHLKDLKAEIKSAEKVNKAEDNEARDNYGRSVVAKGKELTVWYKGELRLGQVVKVGEKTFHIAIAGIEKPLWRHFSDVANESEIAG